MPAIAVCLVVLMAALLLWAPKAGLPPLSTFKVFALALLGCVLIALAGMAALFWGLTRQNEELLFYSIGALVIALIPIIISVLAVGPANLTAPAIHDISTDLQNPPRFDAVAELRDGSDNTLEHGGEGLARKQRAAYPDIEPIISTLSPERALERALGTVENLGWQVIATDSRTIEAFETSRLFGFIDDIIIRVRPHPDGSRLDVRSVSRVGTGDLGANARRIRHFIRAWQAAT